MKRWIALAAAICAAGVVATMAAAARPAAVHHAPTGTALFGYWWTEDPGAWVTVDADGTGSVPHSAPIQAGRPLMIGLTWVGEGYGHTKGFPDVDAFKLTVKKGVQTITDQTWLEGRAQWTEVFPWDSFWLNFLGPMPPFNPHMGNDTYGIDWENLFPAGLPAGVYDVRIDEQFNHTYNDLAAYPDIKKPFRLTPYAATYEFQITVI